MGGHVEHGREQHDTWGGGNMVKLPWLGWLVGGEEVSGRNAVDKSFLVFCKKKIQVIGIFYVMTF
jgi:hypothetical protein